MASDPTPEKTLAHAFASAIAKRQGNTNPRKLRQVRDYERLGREVLRIIRNNQTLSVQED